MKCKFRTARYVLLPAMMMSLFSGCGALAANGMAPWQRSVGPIHYPATEAVTTGEFGWVLGGAGGLRVSTGQMDHQQLQWDPSGAQVVLSVGVGAAWYFFGVLQPTIDDLGKLGG